MRRSSSDPSDHSLNRRPDELPAASGDTYADPAYVELKCWEAAKDAVAACAEDTAGQTCYICLDGGEEGLVRGCSCRGENGFVHMSCLVRAAEVAEESQGESGWARWTTCRLCEQNYHGVVACALGWACWKTYLGQPPEEDQRPRLAMTLLGHGLYEADHYEDALSVYNAQLSLRRRLGESEDNMLIMQANIACIYLQVGRLEEAVRIRQDVYSGLLRLDGKEDRGTLLAAHNLASSFIYLLANGAGLVSQAAGHNLSL